MTLAECLVFHLREVKKTTPLEAFLLLCIIFFSVLFGASYSVLIIISDMIFFV